MFNQNNGLNGGRNYQQLYSQNRSYLPGRIVFSPEQISPQEIPTDGNPAVFPLFDGSKIIAKFYREDGTYGENVYQLVTPPKPKNVQDNYEEVSSRLKSLEDNLNKVMNDLYTEKEVKANE